MMAKRFEDEIAPILISRNWRLVTAESCTSGLIASTVTDVPGSSAYFDRSYVTYSNESKIQMLGVPEEILIKDGAVSESCARLMAEGALSASGVEVALSVTGIAGASGGSIDKPVGTVFMAVCSSSYTSCYLHNFTGDRFEIKGKTVQTALKMLFEFLN